METRLVLAVAFFSLFLFLSGCTMYEDLGKGRPNDTPNMSLEENQTTVPNALADFIRVGNISRTAPPPLPED